MVSRDGRRRARARYSLCLVRCAGVGRGRRAAESALEHATRLGRESGIALAPVVDLYLKAAFGQRFNEQDLRAERTAVNGFARSFKTGVSWPLRILGAVSPRGAAIRRA